MGGCATRTVYVIDDRDDDVVAQAPARRVQRPAPQPEPQAPVVAQNDDDAAYAEGYAQGYADAPNYEADAGIRDAGDFYGPLATYGTWVSYPGYGNVWRPSVAVVGRNFRPYTHGHWEHTEWGWTWVDHHAFGWATGHYGRWFYDTNQGWLWVPGTTWAPAWVTWRTGGSYIGWAAMPPGSIYGGGYSVYDTSWVFVSNGNFGATYIGGVIVTGSGYRSCYASTYPQRGTTVVYGRPVYRGPDYNEVSRNTRVVHRPIRETERDNAVTRPPRGTVVGRDRDDNNGRGGNDGRGSNGTGRDRDDDNGRGGNGGAVVGRDRDDNGTPGRGGNDGRGSNGIGRDRDDNRDDDRNDDGRGNNGVGRDRDDDRGGRTPVVSDPRAPRDLRGDDTMAPRDVAVPGRDRAPTYPTTPTSPTNPVRGGRDDSATYPARGDDVVHPSNPTSPTNPGRGYRDDAVQPGRGDDVVRPMDPTSPTNPGRGGYRDDVVQPGRGDDDNGSSNTPTPVVPRDGSMGGYRGVRETAPTRTYLDDPAVLRDSTRAPGVPTVRGEAPPVRGGAPSRESTVDRNPTVDRSQPSVDRNRTVTPSRPSRGRSETVTPSQPRQPSASPAPSSSSSSSSKKQAPAKSSGKSSSKGKSSGRPR
jgi:hypothetical protein